MIAMHMLEGPKDAKNEGLVKGLTRLSSFDSRSLGEIKAHVGVVLRSSKVRKKCFCSLEIENPNKEQNNV